MSTTWKYRGRTVSDEEIAFLRQLIAGHPHASRRRLSEMVCEAWQWRQTNGALRAMVCRGLLVMLHRAGQLELPPVRFQTRNPFVERAAPPPILIDTTPITGALSAIQPIALFSRCAAPATSRCATA